MLSFFIGLFFGANAGLVIFCMLNASAQADRELEQHVAKELEHVAQQAKQVQQKYDELKKAYNCLNCLNCHWYAIAGEEACKGCGKCTFDE